MRRKGERMGIEESTLDRCLYKGKPTISLGKGEEQRTHEKEKPQINTPISETCFIHSQSIPLSLKHVSYTAHQYPYL